ncbi:HigA family addiction module antitoxin [Brooklawnia sp.]|uniref:HigA family addiction module antitoxin n=1 Tax=Brooklawnia sp. TaxID=2699740 RepID=UPI00311FB6AE
MTTLGAPIADTPIHPGEILIEELLIPLGVSQKRLAAATGLTVQQINQIVRCKCSITAETARCLARYFGTTEQFWLELQSNYDLECTRAGLHC